MPIISEITELRNTASDATALDACRAKRVEEHILALRVALRVASWVSTAATQDALLPPPGGVTLNKMLISLNQQLDALHTINAPGKAIDTVEVDEQHIPFVANLCTLTLKNSQGRGEMLEHCNDIYLVPACNFWLNLISQTISPQNYRLTSKRISMQQSS